MADDPIRIFIVDDHPIVNRGLTTLLDKPESGLKVVGCAFSGKEAVEGITPGKVDVVLMDIRLPEMDGIEATRVLKRADDGLKVIILTTFNDRENIVNAIKVGADGFLLKESSEEDIVGSIKSVVAGQMLISPEAARILADGEGEEKEPLQDSRRKLEQLSQREQEVFVLLTSGKDNNQIAEELCISEHTVRNYVSNIYTILELRNRTAAIIWAQKNGLI